MRACIWVWVLAGCSNSFRVDNVVEGVDADGDGFLAPAAGGEDCDDADPAVNPGADEVCDDGIDNNCDMVVDDAGVGEVVWYPDDDGDGFGRTADAVRACPGAIDQAAYTAFGDDCDDALASVNPGVDQDGCNGVDDDCDGGVDEDEGVYALGQPFGSFDEAINVAVQQTEPVEISVCSTSPVPVSGFVVAGTRDITVRGTLDTPVVLQSKGGATVARVRQEARLALHNVAIEGALASYGVVVEEGATLEMVGVQVRNNEGGGVRAEGLSVAGLTAVTASLVDCELRDNGAPQRDGGGLSAQGAYEITLEGTTIADNEARFGAGVLAVPLAGAAYLSTLTLTGSTVIDNVAAEHGGGLYLEVPTAVTLVDTVVEGNEALRGAGVYARQTEVRGEGTTRIATNEASGWGGGVYLRDTAYLVDLLIEDNTAFEGAGVAATRSGLAHAFPALTRVTVHGNEAVVGGGVRIDSGVTLELNRGAVIGNTASGPGGGAFLGSGAGLEADTVDFGEVYGQPDNAPSDVEINTGASYTFGDAATFDCTTTGGCTGG